jgi:hypothetical protein
MLTVIQQYRVQYARQGSHGRQRELAASVRAFSVKLVGMIMTQCRPQRAYSATPAHMPQLAQPRALCVQTQASKMATPTRPLHV